MEDVRNARSVATLHNLRVCKRFIAREREMVRSAYLDKRHIVKDVGDADYVPWFVDDEFDASGEPNYIDLGGGRFE